MKPARWRPTAWLLMAGAGLVSWDARAVVEPWARAEPSTVLIAALALAALGGSAIGFALRGLRRGGGGDVRHDQDPAQVGADIAWELDGELRFVRVRGAGVSGTTPLLGDRDLGALWKDVKLGTSARVAVAEIETRCARHAAFRDVIVPRDETSSALTYHAVSGAPISARDGRFMGYRGVVRDVTAGFAREEALRTERRRAEEASATKTTFIATMSHELRSPLNAVIGFSEVMSREILGPMGSPRYLAYASDIATAGQHMLSLVNDILGMAKLESGQQALEETEFDLETIIAESIALIRLQAERGRHNVEVKLEAWPRLRADARAVRQILVNLLNNAVKFSNAGGRIEISTAFVVDFGGALRIGVRDFGIGIAPDDIPRLGHPFVQLKAGRERGGGSGLGLAIVRHLAALHDGHVEIVSRPDAGTAVNVFLPASRVIARAAAGHSGGSP